MKSPSQPENDLFRRIPSYNYVGISLLSSDWNMAAEQATGNEM